MNRVFDQNVYSTRLRAFYSPMLGFIPSLGLAVVLWVGGREVIDGDMSLGTFTAFYTYLIMLMGPMRMLGMALGMAQRAVASGNRLFEILDRDPRITSPPDAPELPPGPGAVSFKRVGLRYDGGAPSLTGIDLEVQAGRTVALVGPTGSGKTSLVALIARLYDPSEGSVLGRRRRPARRSTSPRCGARSPSSPTTRSCSATTVAENIAYARPDATREQIELAAKRAQAHEFIARLPDGYETVVGERGLTLSGGQRQRVAIARALIAEPRILILDDATSSVDATTEEEIKRGLREAMEGRTTFVVAHRLSTISLADEIVVMEAGRIVDRGTPRGAARALPAVRRDRRVRLRGRALPPARPRGARGGGETVSDEQRAPRSTETSVPRSQTETEDQANQPGRLAGTLLMFRDLWRLVRGEDERGRKVRWLLGLLRPYRLQVILMSDRAAGRDRRGAGAPVPGREGRSTAGSRAATRAC